MSYSSRVRRDISRWASKGLIDERTAEALARDVEVNERRSLSFGAILATMAALLLGAAILIFVAANWEAFPRPGRVGALFSLILAGYVGGAAFKTADHPAIGEALWLVAAAAFGGALALIGQMYHISGDEAAAMLTWCGGTALAALLLRSGPLTVTAIAIADGWLVLTIFDGFGTTGPFESPHLFLVIAAALFILSYWTRSKGARHVILLSLILYGVLLTLERDRIELAALLAAISGICVGAAALAPGQVEQVVRLDNRLALHGLIGFLAGMSLLQFDLAGDAGAGFVVASAVTLAGIVGAIVLAGRASKGLRWVTYAGFGFELFIIYAVTMHTMLGTAGFFLVAAIIFGLLAAFIIRVEKRIGPADIEEAARP